MQLGQSTRSKQVISVDSSKDRCLSFSVSLSLSFSSFSEWDRLISLGLILPDPNQRIWSQTIRIALHAAKVGRLGFTTRANLNVLSCPFSQQLELKYRMHCHAWQPAACCPKGTLMRGIIPLVQAGPANHCLAQATATCTLWPYRGDLLCSVNLARRCLKYEQRACNFGPT